MEDTHPDTAAPDRARLYDLASEQMGHFTLEQAVVLGYTKALLSYHAKRGNVRRVHRGVYRFRDYPPSPREDVVAAWLAVGRDVAVISNEESGHRQVCAFLNPMLSADISRDEHWDATVGAWS